MKTFKTNKAIALLTLLMLALSSFTSIAQERELKTEKDGFQWYELRQGDKRGAQSVGGTTFIPLSRGYTFICYQTLDGGWFTVEKGDKDDGVCDITGREIIAPGRYDDAYYRNKDGFEYVYVKLNGKEGVCDRNGREIIAPKYNSVLYINNHFSCDDGYYTKEGKPENASASSTTTSSTPTPSPTPQPQPQPQPQPVPQPQPFQVWQQCQYCGGSGDCHVCLGTGRGTSGGYCIICGGRKKCSHCAGQGGHYVIEYR